MNDEAMIEDSNEEEVKPKKKEKKKSTFGSKVESKPKAAESKHIKRGICQLCGANIGRGKKHLKGCKLA